MSKKTSIDVNVSSYNGCYNCRFFERTGKSLSGYGKCLNPLKEAYFYIDIRYIENNTFNYPDKFYPTAGICCIDNCENWEVVTNVR